MPFKSKAQMKYMFANMPETAREWAHKTKDIKQLPEKVKRHKKASVADKAVEDAVAKQVGREFRLKINRPSFHGISKRKAK